MRTIKVYEYEDLCEEDKQKVLLLLVTKMVRGTWNDEYVYQSEEARKIAKVIEDEEGEKFKNSLNAADSLEDIFDVTPTDGDVILKILLEDGFIAAITDELMETAYDVEFIKEDIKNIIMTDIDRESMVLVGYLLGERENYRGEKRSIYELPSELIEMVQSL